MASKIRPNTNARSSILPVDDEIEAVIVAAYYYNSVSGEFEPLTPGAGGGGGSGVEYTEGDVDASITGKAVLWEDGSDTLRAVSAAKPLPVNVVAGAAGGVQYTEADTDASITGTAMLWEDASDTLRAVSAAKPLPVDITDASVEISNDAGNPVPVNGTVTLDAGSLAALETIGLDAATLAALETIGLDASTLTALESTSLNELIAIDAAFGAAPPSLPIAGVRRDADTSPVSATGDAHPLVFDAFGKLKTESFQAFSDVLDLTTAAISAVNGDVVAAVDVSGYRSAFFQLTGTWVGTVSFQGSNDNTNFVSVTAQAVAATTTTPVSTATAVGAWVIPINFKYLRIRVTAYTSGTVTGVGAVTPFPSTLLAVGVATGLTAANNGAASASTQRVTIASDSTGQISPVGRTTGGFTKHRLASAAASTNATSVKGSAGQVYKIYAYNHSASAKFLKLYNKATAPTVGTDTPVETYPLQAGTMTEIDFSGIGSPFATGIGYALTGALADADTTALTAGDVTLNMFYV